MLPRTRKLDEEGHIELFIKCKRCGWEHIIRVSTKELERLIKLEAVLTRQRSASIQRHGESTASIERRISRVQEMIREEKRQLQSEDN